MSLQPRRTLGAPGSPRGAVSRVRLLGWRAAAAAAVLLLAAPAGSLAAAATPAPHVSRAPESGPVAAAAKPNVPVLAYYYMWFNEQSWASRKTDLPALGAYDSTSPTIIRQQVEWAKASGIDALIASWKNTPNLDDALAELVAECERQGMKLVLIYEGLDVKRDPIPASTVSADLRWFDDHYGSNPVFDLYGKPAVIWSGTWKFTADEIAGVRRDVGAPDRLLLLGSEKDAASYADRASLFDGDAYYWSSADPLSTPGYNRRLTDLSSAVHADHGLWLAPAAVGFDARLNNGTSVVDRRNGGTLRAAWNAALATQPDGVAVISWNEYTENSYIEPSRSFGAAYANVLASLTGAPGIAGVPGGAAASAATTATPSAAPTTAVLGATTTSDPSPIDRIASAVVAGLIVLAIVLLAIIVRRRPRDVDPSRAAVDSGGGDAASGRDGDVLLDTSSRRSRRRPRAATVAVAVALALSLVAILVVWAVPNVAGESFVAVQAVVTPAEAATGTTNGPTAAAPSVAGSAQDTTGSVPPPAGSVSIVLGSGGGTATQASALHIAIEVTNRYPLPVVVSAGSSAPFEAAVYLRGTDGKLQRVWQSSAADPGLEEGSDSPAGGPAGSGSSAAVIPSGATRHDVSTGTDLTFPLTFSGGTAREAGTYFVRVWAYGIASPFVPFAIEPSDTGAPA